MKLYLFILPLGLASIVDAQDLSVNWLSPVRQGDGIDLLNGEGVQVSEATLTISQGTPLLNSLESSLAGEHWETPSTIPVFGVADNAVDGMLVRVAPNQGLANWTLEFDVSKPGDWFLIVGSLYRDDSVSHGSVQILGSSSSGSVPLTHLGNAGWDDGTTALLEALDWSAAANELTPRAGNNGESELAFFSLSNPDGSINSLSLTVPTGFPNGAGDGVFVALGYQGIPEPSASLLLALAVAGGLRRRRRS